MRNRSVSAVAVMMAVCMTLSAAPVTFAAQTAGTATAVSTNEGRMVITEGGTYTLTGSMSGTLLIDTSDEVTLIFDGISLDGGSSPAIIKPKGSLIIKARGKNTIRGNNGKHKGVLIGEDITVKSGAFTVYTDRYGFDADTLTMDGGTVKVAGKRTVSYTTKVTTNGGKLILIDDNSSTIANVSASSSDTSSAPADTSSYADTTGSKVSTASSDATSGKDVSSGKASADPAPSSFTGDNSSKDSIVYPQTYTEETAPTENGPTPANDDMIGFPPQPPTGDFDPSDGSDPSSGFAPTGNFDPSGMGMMDAPQNSSEAVSTIDEPSSVPEGTVTNSAMSLTADTENAYSYTMTDENSTVTIDASGTYVITGSASDGSITVKKGTTGVVLILSDLDLISTEGATLSINKNAEVQIVISGSVTLTDNEDPANETSTDEAVADAFDGAAIKVKAGAVTFITGDGTLTVNGNAKNGIKGGDESSIIIGGDVTVDITAASDGINGNYDVTILDGTLNISAGDDAIHADRILTIGNDDGSGPVINISQSEEGLEGTAVSIKGGDITVRSNDDGINAANSDETYSDTMKYTISQTGGTVKITAGGDGYDSNGDIYLIGGQTSISSANMGGEAGIDYDGDFYISDSFSLNNSSGVAGPDGMPGQPGQASQPGQTMQPGSTPPTDIR